MINEAKTFVNAFEDESLFVPTGCDLKTIEPRFRQLITADYVECHRNPRDYFARLAKDFEPGTVRDWLLALAEAPIALIVHRAEVFGGIQHDLSVAGPSPVGRRWIHFRLPKWEPVPTDNRAILELYRATDGTLLSRDAFATSGWVACANVVHVESYDTEYDAPRDPALLLFQSDTGDQLYAVGDVMNVLLHETGETRPIGAVDAIIRSYFEADLTDGRWDSFPG